jgi:bifunctional UDP-N-acetylglucosamine pyrophosphorylase/glucosamine-1-phosphate N-acetyltransferase
MNNAAGEYYLTDIVSIIASKGYKIKTCKVQMTKSKAQIQKRACRIRGIYRKMKAEELLQYGITVQIKTRLDVRGQMFVAGKDCHIDVNVILDGDIVLEIMFQSDQTQFLKMLR